MLLRARLLEAGLQREAQDAFTDPERQHLLDTAAAIGRDARAVSRTIDRIRDILGNVVSQLAPLDIADPIRGALLVLRAELVRQGITVQCEGLDPPHWINGDREQLQLVMLNLIRNAVEATGPGGTVAIAVRSLLRRVEVEVADDGPGFDPAITDLEQVLLATTKPGGTGIGLYLVRCTMDNHRGLVRLRRSSLGGGSVVLEFRSARTRGDMAPGSLQ
jgi:signal transduction histidine kinase